jgi:deoxyribodipyrimidine photo-lyase
LVWFRQDLRLADHPALSAAVGRGQAVVPVFIWAPGEEGAWPPGAASRWWLHQSLNSLDLGLRTLGSRLIIRQGESLAQLGDLARSTGARSIFWSRRYEPSVAARDRSLEQTLAGIGLEIQTFNSTLLHEPWTIENRSGKPFQVFTAYWKNCLAREDPALPMPAPRQVPAPRVWPKSLRLASLELEPRIHWTQTMESTWQPGEPGAQAALRQFLQAAMADYDENRNRPDLPGTSRLSPHLHFGEISPRQVWHAVHSKAQDGADTGLAWRKHQFVTELGWREFAHHLLHHFPHTPERPLREEFAEFAWRLNPQGLKRWQRGETGYPLVDAGLRELWATGWMHNRVRMIVASFLVKDLLISWLEGARWFWDTLVDADLANNTLGWQWTAGCGADAAPYFRIFNPVNQGERFDPQGTYVRRWIPELSSLPNPWIHRPWQAPQAILSQAGIRLGRTYPPPLVSHSIARMVALEAYAGLRP